MYIDKLTISKYTSFFHDGTLFDIQYGKNTSELTLPMESCYIDEEDLHDPIPRSKESTLKGKLYLKGVKHIYVNDKKTSSSLTMNHDDGEIFHLDIKEDKVILHISWCNYPPKERVNDFSSITIEVTDVYWENIPDMEDS